MKNLFNLIFNPTYQIQVRGTDGVRGNFLSVTGRSEKNKLIKKIKDSRYDNVISISLIYSSEKPGYTKSPWYIDEQEENGMIDKSKINMNGERKGQKQ